MSTRYPLAAHITYILDIIIEQSIPGAKYYETSDTNYQLRAPMTVDDYYDEQRLDEGEINDKAVESQDISDHERITCSSIRSGRSALDVRISQRRYIKMDTPISFRRKQLLVCPRPLIDDHIYVYEPTLVMRRSRDLQRQNNLKCNSPSSSPTRGSAGETEHDVDDSPPILFSTNSKFNYNNKLQSQSR